MLVAAMRGRVAFLIGSFDRRDGVYTLRSCIHWADRNHRFTHCAHQFERPMLSETDAIRTNGLSREVVIHSLLCSKISLDAASQLQWAGRLPL